MFKHDHWLVVDTETTGLRNPIYPVEIAGQRMKGWQAIGDPFRVLIDFDVPIESRAEWIHGYSREYLHEHGLPPEIALSSFLKYSENLPIVTYNMFYDWDRVLIPTFQRLGYSQKLSRGFCALELTQQLVTGLPNHKFNTVIKAFCIAQEQLHKAEADVQLLVILLSNYLGPYMQKCRIKGYNQVAQCANGGTFIVPLNFQSLNKNYSEKAVLNPEGHRLRGIDYHKAASKGDKEAQVYLGVLNQNGQGIERDCTQAVVWFHMAADQGHMLAQYFLGVLYENGKGVEQDYEKAVFWYRKAAKQGDKDAQYNLGIKYEHGQGVEQNNNQAITWFRKAANQASVRAQCSLGDVYNNGKGVEQDFKRAVVWYRKAADQGYPLAQYSLGVLYENGQGVEQDFEQAAVWYRKAAIQGHILAQYSLGVLYENGQGVEIDYFKAIEFYRRAADQGNNGAQVHLANLYSKSKGVVDLVEAYKWLLLAGMGGEKVEKFKRKLQQLITKGQIAEAQRQAREFIPKIEENNR